MNLRQAAPAALALAAYALLGWFIGRGRAGTALGISGSQSAWSALGSFSTAFSGNNLELIWTAAAIPEPSTYAALLGAAVLTLAVIRRRRDRQAA